MLGCDNMAKKKRVRKKAKRIATFGIVSIFIITIILTTFFGVIIQLLDKYQEKEELENSLVYLEEKKMELENEVEKLKDPEYLARYAREKYFYSKDGELIIRIPDSK